MLLVDFKFSDGEGGWIFFLDGIILILGVSIDFIGDEIFGSLISLETLNNSLFKFCSSFKNVSYALNKNFY